MNISKKDDKRKPKKEIVEPFDYYFAFYTHNSIHYEMLSDTHRTLSYRAAIVDNPHLFADKLVMDIGCGTAILSMFAAQAGARKVVAVDAAGIIAVARRIVRENGYEKVIELVRGRVEEVSVPVAAVHVIVSEWMGYLLLFEGMLDSVLHARDKYLAKGGQLFPNLEIIYAAGFTDHEFQDKVVRYSDYKGVNHSEFADIKYIFPVIDILPENRIITNDVEVTRMNLETITVAQLDFSKQFRLRAKSDGTLHGIVMWFDSLFTHGSAPVNLTTSPHSAPTHWKQGLLYFKRPLDVTKGDAIDVILTLKKHPLNGRNVDLRVDYRYKKGDLVIKEHMFYMYK